MTEQQEHQGQAQRPLVMNWTLGDRLRKIRRTLGMSSREFSQSLGVTNSTLAQWETDRSLPRNAVDVAHKIFFTYGVSVEWVLFGCCEHNLYGVSPQESLALSRRQMEQGIAFRSGD